MWPIFPAGFRFAGVLALAQFVLLTISTVALPPVFQPPASETVRMPVLYESEMLVVVSPEGVAGVRFFGAFEKGNESGDGVVGTSYEWRYLPRKPDAVEQTGSGRVFSKLVDSVVLHGSFDVTCGPLQLTWSHTDAKSGSVRFDPCQVAVHPLPGHSFAERKAPVVDTMKAIDLSRFFEFSDELVSHSRRADAYVRPNAHQSKGVIASPVLYANCVLVAKDPNGVATFKFEKVFERDRDQNEKHYGVPYEFKFQSHDGKYSQSGKGEVYERYTGGKYDHGQLHVEAGPLRFEWSRGGSERGWVYCDPQVTRVWNVDAADVKSLVDAITSPDRLPD